MSRFRKRPLEVEAIQFLGITDGVARFGGDAGWLREALIDKALRAVVTNVFVSTLEGTMQASPGDWIIRGVLGELYPCKPDAFERTYEPVEASG